MLRTAYGWTAEAVAKLSPTEQRQAVTKKLCELSADSEEFFCEMGGPELTGRCAILVFLLGAKIRFPEDLKKMRVDPQRCVLIHGISVATDRRLKEADLERMNHNALVQLAGQSLDQSLDRDFIRLRLAELSAVEQEAILNDVTTMTGFPLAQGYPKEFAEFKSTGVATFRIPPPSRLSIAQEHPFAPFYNTRLTRVRVWIRGVQPKDSMCHVMIKPAGIETVCDSDLNPVSFEHAPLEKFSFTQKSAT